MEVVVGHLCGKFGSHKIFRKIIGNIIVFRMSLRTHSSAFEAHESIYKSFDGSLHINFNMTILEFKWNRLNDFIKHRHTGCCQECSLCLLSAGKEKGLATRLKRF